MSSSRRTSILKRLQSEMPRGKPLDSHGLASVGVYPELAYRYVRSGWLERLGRGVLMFASDQLQRDRCLAFLAGRVAGFHVGGKSALALHGLRHNVPAREVLSLWGEKSTRIPQWFSSRFPSRYTARSLFAESLLRGFGLQTLPEDPDGPPVSVPERALLEMLSEVGVSQELDEARLIVETARSLRADVLAELLRACRQQKALRLCVSWAEELALPWASVARKAAEPLIGSNRWVSKRKNGKSLILKP